MCHVLIIEDEALIALDLQHILESAGALSFSFAETEQGAIAAARCRRPDVILSDVMLREGTGPLAVQVIQNEMGPLPVIFVTGTPEACTPCERSVPVLAKPVMETAVRDAFRAVAPV